MVMSDFRIIAVGREEFVLPFGAVGFEFKKKDNLEQGLEYILEQDISACLFIMDEDIIDNENKVEEALATGANILVLKAWEESKLSREKIRQASIKAIGIAIRDTEL